MTFSELSHLRRLSQELRHLAPLLPLLSLAPVVLMAFTEHQRQEIKERDNHRCQFPMPHECNWKKGNKYQHIHHIIPQRYAKENGIDPDFVENGISICQNAHNLIHPDMAQAMHDYAHDKKAIEKVFDARDRLLEKKKPYWDTSWDRLLHATAIRNTQRKRV